MQTLLQDVRNAWRMLLKHKGFSLLAVFTLALGIGANTAIFSVVNALLLRPLPFRDSDKLVQLWETEVKHGQNTETVAYPNFADWRDQNRVFEQIAAYSDRTFNLTGTAEPERIQGAIVSPAFFPMLRIKPMLGRVLLPEEDQPNKVFTVVMGERLWRRRFNSDAHIIGQVIDLNHESFTVVGVIANVTDLSGMPNETELWVSIAHSRGFDNRRGHYLSVLARLKPDVTLEQAQANMDSVAAALAAQYRDSNIDHGVRLVPLQEQIVGDFKLALLVLLGAVAFVLLIASANVANMLLAQGASRRKEIAIRTALGAGRWRLIRQLLTESLLLSLLGGAVGVLLALWGVYLLVAFGPADLPRAREIGVDGRVLVFTLAVSLLTGIIFGLFPALQASRPDLNETLKESGRSAMGSTGHRRARSLLVVSEIALSLVLLVGAGLFIRSFLKLQAVNPGFNPQNLLTTRISLRGPNYQNDAPVIAFHDQLLDQIRVMPGVQSVATRSYIPIASDEDYAHLSFSIEGRFSDPANRPIAFYNAVSPDYFHTMGISVLEGRSFDVHDDKKAENVSIVNETLARHYFPGEDPIGKRISLKDENQREEDWATIVGIVKDTKPRKLDRDAVAEMYMPFAQQPQSAMAFMIRTTSKPESMAVALRRAVHSLDKDQPVYGVRTLESVLSDAVAAPRFRTSLLGVFAAVAVILAMVGIYGVMSYSVTQRTREIGIRMALGARGREVLTMILREGVLLVLLGLTIGLACAFALTRLIARLLFGVVTRDPVTFAATAALLVLVALLACYIPARRATKVDPLVALRCE